MKMQTQFLGGISIKFDGIPPAEIRSALKANGFRWIPDAKIWFRQRAAGAADLMGWIEKKLNPDRPDGPCWDCGEPGRFRNYGAAAPVYCDACHAKHK